jgi:hypothetical protein
LARFLNNAAFSPDFQNGGQAGNGVACVIKTYPPQIFKTAARQGTVPEIIDPVFAKRSPKRSLSMTEYKRFGLVFTKTRFYKFEIWAQVLFVIKLIYPEFSKWRPDRGRV